MLKSLSAADSNGKAITVTNSTFQMPASDVTVTATFEKKPEEGDKEVDPKNISVKADSFNGLWQFAGRGYRDICGCRIAKVSVDEPVGKLSSFTPSTGGKYRVRERCIGICAEELPARPRR